MERMAVIFLLLIACSCKGSPSATRPADRLSDADRQALHEEFGGRPPGGAVERRAYPVAQGKLPLSYICPAEATVRVVDAASGTVVGVGLAKANSMISVDAARGVRIGREQVAPGPLASDRTYAVYVVPEEQPAGGFPGR